MSILSHFKTKTYLVALNQMCTNKAKVRKEHTFKRSTITFLRVSILTHFKTKTYLVALRHMYTNKAKATKEQIPFPDLFELFFICLF